MRYFATTVCAFPHAIDFVLLAHTVVIVTGYNSMLYGDPIANSTCGSQTLSVPMCYCHQGFLKDWSENKCKKCHPGYFQEHNNAQGACSLCAQGRFANESGQGTCKLCPAGKYGFSSNPIMSVSGTIDGLTNYGATACKSCPAGFYSIPLSHMINHDIPCEKCEAGKYSPRSGSLKCRSCGSGTYQNEVGQSTCKLCPPGQFKNSSIHLSHTCHLSRPGFFSNNRISEEPCGKGTYSDTPGSEQCKLCEVGKFMSHTAAKNCINCADREYQPLEGATDGCKFCPLGQSSFTYPRVNCTPGPLGTYDTLAINNGSDLHSGIGDFLYAPPGWYAPAGCLELKRCEVGRYSTVKGSSYCNPCPSGKHTAMYTQATTCKDAKTGHYATNGRERPCPPTTYNDELSRSFCKQCREGTYSVHLHSINCSIARPGHFATKGNEYVCTKGKYTHEWGASSCKACEPGKYQHLSASSTCHKCHRGTSSKITGLSADGCKLCNPGQYTSEKGMLTCKLCSAGKAISVAGFHDNDCPTCKSGSYSDESGAKTCKSCLPGKYSELEAATRCTLCQPGRYSWSEKSVKCREADEGHVPADNHSSQVACVAGTIAPGRGNSKCAKCKKGSFVEHDRAVECELCPSGRVQHLEGKSECSKCSPGKYSDEVGSSQCILCPAGRTRSGTAEELGAEDAKKYWSDFERHDINSVLNQCHKCNVGRYQPDEGSHLEECLPCPLGKYVNQRGAQECLPCGIHHFVHSEGSTGCELCLTLSNSFGISNLQQCSITVYILSFTSLFFLCCCSCIAWGCCGFRCPRACKETQQLKSQTSIQKIKSQTSVDAMEKCSQNSFDASRFVKKHTKSRAFPQTLPLYKSKKKLLLYKNKKKRKQKACLSIEDRSVTTPLEQPKERQRMEIGDPCLMLSKPKRWHTGKMSDRPSVALELSMCNNPMLTQKRK